MYVEVNYFHLKFNISFFFEGKFWSVGIKIGQLCFIRFHILRCEFDTWMITLESRCLMNGSWLTVQEFGYPTRKTTRITCNWCFPQTS